LKWQDEDRFMQKKVFLYLFVYQNEST